MSFHRRHVPALGREVFRLGLACNYGIDARGFDEALERGIDYVFWTSMRTGHLKEPLRDALRRDRQKLVVAAGPTIAWFAGNVRRGCEKLLRELGTDYIDVLHLFWLGKTSALTEGTVDALRALKEEGKIRAIGTSIHDRVRAGKLVADSPIDLFMIRYNAAHPGAERDVFPHLARRKPAIVAYTATSWRKLLKAPRGWTGPVMTAGDCYRFDLSNPHVDLTLTGPANAEQLRETLAALEKGPLTPDEEAWMRAFGQRVHGGRASPAAA
ncbi:MAG: aldo/keto reductase [Deltaproteobacteria bacterium]|nr:aldo/keto reductase [Deltaproteobacteria bacterium]